MPREKFKLSDTVKFLTRKLNAVVGVKDTSVTIEIEQPEVQPGAEVSASVRVVCGGEVSRTLDALVITMRGKVQRDNAWRDYTEAVEVGQGHVLEPGHELVVPLVVYVPEDAVLSEDGGQWGFEARAVLDRAIDPRAEASFEVAGEILRDEEGQEADEEE